MDIFKNRDCLFFDIETLGVRASSVLLDFALIPVDFNKPDEITIDNLRKNAFYRKLDAKDQIRRGRTVDQATIDFWNRQPKDVKELILPKDDDISVETFYNDLKVFLDERNINARDAFFFCRGNKDIEWFQDLELNTLDLVLDEDSLFSFWNYNDTRSLIRAAVNVERGRFDISEDEVSEIKELKSHSAIDDVIYDILRLNLIINE